MNKVILLRQRNTLHYYSDVLGDTHCVYGFLNRDSALNCREFLVRYRMQHKRYPFIGQVKVTRYTGTDDSVLLEERTLEDMKNKCVLNGVHLIGIHTFDYQSTEEVRLSGTILTEDYEAEQEYIKENLEHLITF